jgi:hypothetical protein
VTEARPADRRHTCARAIAEQFAVPYGEDPPFTTRTDFPFWQNYDLKVRGAEGREFIENDKKRIMRLLRAWLRYVK